MVEHHNTTPAFCPGEGFLKFAGGVVQHVMSEQLLNFLLVSQIVSCSTSL